MKALLFLAACLVPASAFADANKASTMHYMKAVLLEQRGNVVEALQEYQAAIALDPQSSFLVEQAVEAALEAGKQDVAITMAKRLIELDPQSHKARLLLGNVEWARGNVPGAQAAFEEALKLNPRFSEAMLSLGSLLSAQSPDKARTYLQDYLASNPENAGEAHFSLAMLEQKEGRLDDAIRHLRAAVEINPDAFQARFTLAQLYEAKKDTEAALGEYLAILSRDSENVALRNHIGEIYFMKGDVEAAAEQFRHAQAAAPDNPTACLWLAILAEQRGDFGAAVGELAKSAALKDEAALNLRLSYYLTQANRLKEAVAVLEAAHKKWPDNDDVAYFLALGYDDLKDQGKAEALFKSILKSRPDFRDARFQLGALYEKNDRLADAEREFRVLIDQRPNDASALNYLGYSLTDRGLKLPEAEHLVRRAVAIDPTNGAYRDSLGWSHFKQGRFVEARAELENSLRLLPSDATVWEHLGDALTALAEKGRAWEAYIQAEGFEPNERVKKKRAEVEAGIPADELGRRSLELAGAGLKGLSSFGGPCEVSVLVGNKPLAFPGLLRFNAPSELELDLLGPLFVPILRVRLAGEDGFEMDPVRLEGVPPEAVQDAVYRGLRLVREYLAGRLFGGRPAELKRTWRSESVRTPDGDFNFRDGRLVRSFESAAQPPIKLSVEYGGPPRRLPVLLRLEGKGFKLELLLSEPVARFDSEAAAAR
ncbi:MAG: tetratricopeptide repeat protein [Elusimicrobia bacterium]|nr:tetratricopeptide repeat protein [Elusimicrobiota bacterium]